MPLFTKEKDKKLISLVQSKPFLYKPSVPGYKDQLAKSLAWEEISDKLEIPLPAIRRRWKYIKDQCRKNAQDQFQNDTDSEINNTQVDLRDQMYKKKINGKWCMVLLPPSKENLDDEEDETEDIGLKQENTDDDDDTKDLGDIEDRRYINVFENQDTRKVPTSDYFNTVDRKRKKIMDDLKQKHRKGAKVEKLIAQDMETLKIEDEIDGIQNLNGKKRKIMLNSHDTKFEGNGKFNSDNKSKNINSHIMDSLRQKLGLCLTKMAKYKRSNISNLERSPMHKFFEEAASIVTMFPPDLACETSLMIYREIIDEEMY